MGRRYLARFDCVDCGEPTERMWESPRPKVCLECAKIRREVATDGARAALEEHTRLCRLRLAQRRLAASEGLEEGAKLLPLRVGAGGGTRTDRREEAQP